MTRHADEFERADHYRDHQKHQPSPRHQKRAVCELTGYAWGLIGAGILSPEIEKQLLARIRNTCVEFDMDPPGGPYLRKHEPA